MNKKILVTGATGYVGQNLVTSLIKKGYIVYALTRKESSIFSNNKNVNVITGDITDHIDLPSDIKTIYHCAGIIHESKEMEKVNVLGTQNIVDLAIKNDCALIHLSSAGVVGKTEEIILDERTSCHPQNAYEISKYKAEQIVIEGIKKGLRAHILRPTSIFGNGQNSRNDSFLQLAKSMRTGLYKNIRQGIYNIVHIDEVIKAMELLDEKNIPFGDIYIINNTITYKNMDMLVKNLSPIVEKKTQQIPYFIAFITMTILSILYFMVNQKNPLTFSRLKALTNKKIYSQNKIIETISFKNNLQIEEYVRKVCIEYINLGLMP
ncbi:MAG: NAD-dependent epimerase/dehydratase family protein [bacterium]|nr:NAD-dependent epimerase/dehydratase family protein [bacterium]